MTTERDVLRELEAALDVSPSADFEARVRARMRKESIAAPRWTWAAGVAIAATVVLAIVLVPDRPMPVARVASPENSREAVVVPLPIESAADATGRGKPQPVRTVSAQDAAATPRPARRDAVPSVVVPPGQMTAIQRLVAAVAAGRIVAAPDRPDPPVPLQVTALEAAAPIEFDTIRFTPLSAEASPDLWR